METNKDRALIVGSVAFDIIFSVEGNMRDEFPLSGSALRSINITLIANGRTQYYGGTAANIAYGMGLLNNSTFLFSVVGDDFYPNFEERLKKHNVEPRVIRGEKGSFTAHAYQISDKKHQQIVIWQPNVYYDLINEVGLDTTITEKDFDSIKVAIFSPGTPASTLNHLLEFNKKKRKDAISIFDPSRILNLFTKEQMTQCLGLSNMVISNDIEIASLRNNFGLDIPAVLNSGPDMVIETKGEEGSIIHTKDENVFIQAAKPKKVIETTGAGDAYRAGLIHGILKGEQIEQAAKYGAVIGSFCVECYSGQTYSFTEDEFQDRLDSLGFLNRVESRKK
ncbi:hypothetical protein JW796_01945 [Candidatus Dojkabacteria bacterium]|nr:hypothetical protein [Candidatus Dojkabacteria bacterium]